MKPKVLCVCSKGVNRSKYLAKYLKNKGYATRFGGAEIWAKISRNPNPISQADVEWADIIIVTRKRLAPKIKKKFDTKGKRLIVLNVVDSLRLLPKEYAHLKKAGKHTGAFAKQWREPQLRKAIKPYLPL